MEHHRRAQRPTSTICRSNEAESKRLLLAAQYNGIFCSTADSLNYILPQRATWTRNSAGVPGFAASYDRLQRYPAISYTSRSVGRWSDDDELEALGSGRSRNYAATRSPAPVVDGSKGFSFHSITRHLGRAAAGSFGAESERSVLENVFGVSAPTGWTTVRSSNSGTLRASRNRINEVAALPTVRHRLSGCRRLYVSEKSAFPAPTFAGQA